MIERLAVLTALALLLPRPGSAATLGELEAWCAPPDKSGRPSLCEGYLEANLELLASPDPTSNGGVRACVPPEEDRAHRRSDARLCASPSRSPQSRQRHGAGQGVGGTLPVSRKMMVVLRMWRPRRAARGTQTNDVAARGMEAAAQARR